jgi:hypothetical protein
MKGYTTGCSMSSVNVVQGPMKCMGGCCSPKEHTELGKACYECHEPCVDDVSSCNLVLDLGNARSAPGVDVVPTFTTNNKRMCLLLANGEMGMLRIEDAERLQVFFLILFKEIYAGLYTDCVRLAHGFGAATRAT